MIRQNLTLTALICVFFITTQSVHAAGCRLSKTMLDGAEHITIENDYVLMTFVPYRGGVCIRFLDKLTNSDWTQAKSGAGLFDDNLWQQQRYSHGDWNNAAYTPKILVNTPDTVSLQLTGKGKTGDLQFMLFRKIITLHRRSAAIHVNYTFQVQNAAMSKKTVGLWFHNSIAVKDKKIHYYYPKKEGVVSFNYDPAAPPDEIWEYEPRQGWIGAVTEDGAGMGVRMDYRHLMCFYQWFGRNLSTLEWMFRNVTIPHGGEFNTFIILTPFSGLDHVDGIGDGAVAALNFSEKVAAPGVVSLSAKIWIAEAMKDAQAVWEVRQLPSRIWTPIDRPQPLGLPKPGTVRVKGTLTTTATGTYAVRLVVKHGGKILVVAEKPHIVGKSNLSYSMLPEAKRLGNPNDRFGKIAFKTKDVELPITNKVVTPHIPWAKPYAKGKLKILILMHNYNAREVVELAERMDIDYDAPLIDYGNPCYIGDVYGKLNLAVINEILKKYLQKQGYDVILVSDPMWSKLDRELPELLAKQVKNGVGLVYITPRDLQKAGGENTWGILPVQVNKPQRCLGNFRWLATREHPITDGVPLAILPPVSQALGYLPKAPDTVFMEGRKNKRAPLGIFSEQDGHRIVVFNYRASRVGSGYGGTLIPFIRFPKERFQYWEYFYSLLAKALLWVAKREPDIKLHWRKTDTAVTVSMDGPGINNLGASYVECLLRDESGKIRARKKLTVNPKAGTTEAVFTLPNALESGLYLFDTILRCQGASVTWGTYAFQIKLSSHIIDFELPGGESSEFGAHFYKTGDTVCPSAVVCAKGNDFILDAVLSDALGRDLAKKQLRVPMGERQIIKIPFTIAHPLVRVGFIRIALRRKERLFDKSDVDFVTILDKDVNGTWDDFEFIPWGSMGGYDQEYLIPTKAKICKDAGITTMYLNSNWNGKGAMGDLRIEHESSLRAGFRAIEINMWSSYPDGYNEDRKNYQKTKNKIYLYRKPSLSDTAYMTRMIKKVRNKAKIYKKLYPMAWMWGDEQSVIGRIPVMDYDFSPQGLNGFRQWLAEEYGTLEMLNREWRANFTTWPEVVPLTGSEARNAHNFASWSDHRTFMEVSYTRFFAMLTRTLQEVSPNCMQGVSGTEAPSAYNGCNWSQLGQIFTYLQPYYSNGLDEILPSLCSHIPRARWTGYGNLNSPSSRLWKCFFLGDRGISYFALRSFLNPDFTYTKQAQLIIKAIKPMRMGLSKLWSCVRPDTDAIAVLHSQRSIHGAYLLDKEWYLPLKGWFSALRNAGFAPKLITDRQIDAGILTPDRFKVLVLPFISSISRTQALRIQEYARTGGIVLADCFTGVFDGHCQYTSKGMLDGIFGITHTGFKTEGPATNITFAENDSKTANLKGLTTRTKLAEKNIALNGGTALGVHGTIPYAVFNTTGKGKTCYLNLDMGKYAGLQNRPAGAFYRKLFKRLIDWSGLQPIVKIQPARYATAIYRQREGRNVYIGYLRPDNINASWTVELKSPKHVYNIMTGTYLGYTAEIPSGNSPQSVDFFGLLAYKVKALKLIQPTKNAICGNRTVIRLALLTNAESPDTHSIHMTVLQPDGSEAFHYSGNVLIKKGKGKFVIPFALNDPIGTWTIKARDCITATTGKCLIKLAPGI